MEERLNDVSDARNPSTSSISNMSIQGRLRYIRFVLEDWEPKKFKSKNKTKLVQTHRTPGEFKLRPGYIWEAMHHARRGTLTDDAHRMGWERELYNLRWYVYYMKQKKPIKDVTVENLKGIQILALGNPDVKKLMDLVELQPIGEEGDFEHYKEVRETLYGSLAGKGNDYPQMALMLEMIARSSYILQRLDVMTMEAARVKDRVVMRELNADRHKEVRLYLDMIKTFTNCSFALRRKLGQAELNRLAKEIFPDASQTT